MTRSDHCDVAIVGGGLAGLSCAVELTRAGRRVTLLEATDRVGGRVRTDVVDGFTLDHGFQVLLTAYPACRELLDYDALRLRRFEPGVLIRQNGRFTLLGDPWRRPSQTLATALNPVGSFADKLRLVRLRRASRRGELEELYRRRHSSTLEHLEQFGFSQRMIDQFFRPWLGSMFLDETLSASSRMLEFVLRMLSGGEIAVPADGMAAIPRQLSEQLPRGTIRLRSTVAKVSEDRVVLTDRSQITADQVVVATESNAAARLLGAEAATTAWASTSTLYYAADSSPQPRKWLMLRGDEPGPVQTAAVMSHVAPSYAPGDRTLLAVNVASGDDDPLTGDTDQLDRLVRRQLSGWFGQPADDWRLLRVYRVPFGLPQTGLDPVLAPLEASQLGGTPGVLVCGDHRETPSIQGAMHSGQRAARAVLNRSPCSVRAKD